MPVTVTERYATWRQTGKDASREYIIRGTADDTAARAALLAEADAEIDTSPTTAAPLGITLYLQEADCEVEELADGIWIGTAVYQSQTAEGGEQPINSFRISFDITGQSVRVTQARHHLADYAAGGGL